MTSILVQVGSALRRVALATTLAFGASLSPAYAQSVDFDTISGGFTGNNLFGSAAGNATADVSTPALGSFAPPL